MVSVLEPCDGVNWKDQRVIADDDRLREAVEGAEEDVDDAPVVKSAKKEI